jgi:hypothetical protein
MPAFQQWCNQMGGSYLNKNDMFNPDCYQTYAEYLHIMTKYFNLDNPAPFLSARSWIMLNMDNKEVLFAKEEN